MSNSMIALDAAQALMELKLWASGNTTIRVVKKVGMMMLCGEKIAIHKGREKTLEVTVGTKNTPTVRRRLNAIPGIQVTMKNNLLYLNGEPWDGELKKFNVEDLT